MSVDFENFDSGNHTGGSDDPVPPGDYVLTVKSFKRNTRNGKEQIDFTVIPVLDGDRNKVDADCFQPVWETVTLTEAAAWRLANLLEAVKASPPINVMSDRSLSAVVKWKPFKARIVRDSYNGKVKAKIDRYMALTTTDVRAFDEVIEDMAVDRATGGGDSGASGSRGSQGSGGGDMSDTAGTPDYDIDDDDLPF